MSSHADSVLVVEDDPQMRRYLRATLAGQGFRVIEAATLGVATQRAAELVPDLVLLDLGMPDGDGLELLTQLRGWTRMPVIVLSARGREHDKIAALDGGADDYLTKPFGAGELHARIRVALRHARAGAGATTATIEIGPIRIDQERREVTVDGTSVHLTPIEYRLLTELARHAGRVLTHSHLLRTIWGPNAIGQSQYLRVHVAALRRKIERHPARPRWLTTEAGVGYRFRDG